MIVLYGPSAMWDKFSQAEQSQILEKYYAWVAKLKGENRFKSGSELSRSARELKNVGGCIVVDGPFAETKEALTGYFMIEAESIDEAAEIAKGCPALGHGETVQVYEIPKRGG